MELKNKVIRYLKEEEWRSRNTKDIDGLKKIQRELMRTYASGNKEIFRDDAIRVAKETNPDEKKKFVRYINKIFANDKNLTYKEFAERVVKQGTTKTDSYRITYPAGYEDTQVLDRVKNIGEDKVSSAIDNLFSEIKEK